MNINDAIALLGKPINTPEMVEFFEKYGFKYPKKLTRSGRTTEPTFWIQNKKLKMDLLFSIEGHSKKYPPLPAERKNTFYPILSNINIYNPNGDFENMPFELNFKMSFDELKHKLGEPEANQHILNDDGSPHFYYWVIDLNDEKQMMVENRLPEGGECYTSSIWLNIKENHPLIQFWYPKTGENFESFIKQLPYNAQIEHQFEPLNHRSVTGLFFLRWLIENDIVIKTDENKEILQAVKTGQKDVFELLKVLDMCYLGEDDIIEQKAQTIIDYIHNLNGDLPYYHDDIESIFLTKEEFKRTKCTGRRWLDSTKLLNERVSYNEDNYQKVKAILDSKGF